MDYADALSRSSRARQDMDDVVGLPKPVGDVVLGRMHRRGIDQAVRRQPLGAKLVGVDMPQAPLRKGQQGIKINRSWTPVLLHQGRQLGVRQQMAKHLRREGAVLETAADREHPLEGFRVLQKRREP